MDRRVAEAIGDDFLPGVGKVRVFDGVTPRVESPDQAAGVVILVPSGLEAAGVGEGQQVVPGVVAERVCVAVAVDERGEAALVGRASAGLEAVLDFYLSVGTPVQHATAELLSLRSHIQSQILGRLATNSVLLSRLVGRRSDCRMLKRQGGWYAILEFNDHLTDEARVVDWLESKDILVHPGYFYDFGREGFAVVSLLVPGDLFQTGIGRMLEQ